MAAYRLLRRIAAGGMAEVFLARAGDGPLVALKRVLPHLAEHPEIAALFAAEARRAAAFDHPGIVRVVEAGPGFLALEHVDGPDLGAVLRRARLDRRPVPPTVAAFVVAAAARALAVVHEAGVVHRDVSPSNLLVSLAGEVKLSDFGIAAQAGAPPGPGRGKARYLAPEELAGANADPAADVWSLGVVLEELAPSFAAIVLATRASQAARPSAALVAALLERTGPATASAVARYLAGLRSTSLSPGEPSQPTGC